MQKVRLGSRPKTKTKPIETRGVVRKLISALCIYPNKSMMKKPSQVKTSTYLYIPVASPVPFFSARSAKTLL